MKEQNEKQAIEEMAKVIEITEQIARDAHCGLPSPTMYAKDLYWKGYRKQEWVSVEDRLPKQWEYVLVYCCDEIGTDFIASNGRWYEHINDTVTHWMPLPEPPKMKGGAG